MMQEVLTNYGPVWELWWDGANGEGPNGKQQVYDWKRFEKTVRALSPNTVVFSDIGPDARWCGNEDGIAGKTNWNTLDTAGFTRGAGAPKPDTLNAGNANGKNWIPAECDVSIRPGWFYHKAEDRKVKTPEQLFELYLKSVGRGANLLLNVPPDGRGLITGYDSAALVGFRKLANDNFKFNLIKNEEINLLSHHSVFVKANKLNDEIDSTVEFTHLGSQENIFSCRFNKEKKINAIVLKEHLEMGQRIVQFKITLYGKKKDKRIILGTTIGQKRIITFPAYKTSELQFELADYCGNWSSLKEIEVYLIDEKLTEK